MRVLNVAVDPALVPQWSAWLAPAVQPFFVESLRAWPKSVTAGEITPELRDTYRLWRIDKALKTLWLDEPTFNDMARAQRAQLVRVQVVGSRGAVPTVRGWSDLIEPATLRTQADGHRFVWWPSLVTTNASGIVRRYVGEDRVPSRHREVTAATWKRAAARLPHARALAGTFASGSGPNCFGTVVGAAGVAGAADQWLLQEPFEQWLIGATSRGGDDRAPGTVLVWRDRGGLPIHAAVTLGDGWALEKPSQEWSSPRTVVAVDDLVRWNRLRGVHLKRHTLTPSAS